MIELVEIGVNLGHRQFNRDRAAVVDRALAAGVTGLIITGTNLRTSHEALALTQGRPGILWCTAAKLQRACNGAVDLFYLDAGFLHYFDTTRVHTLINAADEERITLSIDLVENDWLKEWMRTNLAAKVSPSPISTSSAIRWNWNSLRHGIIRTA